VGDNYETRKRVLVETSEKEIVTEGLLPAVERSSGVETMTDGLLPAVERSFEEETATVDGNDGQDLRTLDPDGTRDQRAPASDGRLGAVLRTMVVERSSGEETVTSSMRVGLRPSVEAALGRGTRDRHCTRFTFGDRGPSSC
jgi:hypothetical protein